MLFLSGAFAVRPVRRIIHLRHGGAGQADRKERCCHDLSLSQLAVHVVPFRSIRGLTLSNMN